MIIALAGRRIDAKDADPSRFPPRNRKKVKETLKTLFKKTSVKGLVCSAACGADLLALEAADELNLHYRIVLPSERKKFREKSVTDRGGDWGEVFDKIYNKAKKRREVIELISSTENDEIYIETNNRILDEAVLLARKCSHKAVKDVSEELIEKKILVVIVWEGKSRGDDDITAKFAETGRSRGFKLEQVLTK